MTPRQMADRLQLAAGGAFRSLLETRLKGVAMRMQAQGIKNVKARMNVRNGYLWRSIAPVIESEGAPRGGIGPLQPGADIMVGVRAGGVLVRGAEVIYAGIQERGGTVRPVRRRWLAIPTDEVKTKTGVARYASPRDYPGALRFIPLRPGLAMLVEAPKSARRGVRRAAVARRPPARRKPARREKKTRLKALWWLVKQTTIRPKWYLRDAFDAEAARVPAVLDDVLRSVLEARP